MSIETMTDDEFARYMEGQLSNADNSANEEAIVDSVDEPEEEVVENVEEDEADNEEVYADEETEDEDEVSEDEDLEQSNNLDSNEVAEDAEADEDSDEDPESEAEEGTVTPDKDTEDKSKDDGKEATNVSDDVQQPQNYKVKANGVEFEFTTDELLAMAPKAIDYTKKMQEIAPWRRSISAMKEANLTHDDINTMIDVLKGDKAAISEVLKRTGVTTLDLDAEEETVYKPRNYGMNETELAINDVVNDISMDSEYQITQNVVDKQWDDRSRSKLVENPELIAELHKDVKSGVYDAVAPLAMKRKVLDGARKSDLDYYVEAGRDYYAQKEMQQVAQQQAALKAQQEAEQAKAELEAIKAQKQKQASIKKSAKRKKSAAPTKGRSGTKDVIDYLDMDSMTDEQFSEFMDKQVLK